MYNTVVILLPLSQTIYNHTCRLAHKYPSYWPLWLRNVPNISQSTVSCGRISTDDFITNWLPSLTTKEHQEAVGNWGSYGARVQWHLFSTDGGSDFCITLCTYTHSCLPVLFWAEPVLATCLPDLDGRSVQNAIGCFSGLKACEVSLPPGAEYW